MKRKLLTFCCVLLAMTATAQRLRTGDATSGILTDAMPDEVWNESEWICVADAPEVTGCVNEDTRAADGANWFVTTIKNEKKVVKALWMTTSLGVNELYVNGQRIGREVLRPGFSHHSRTKYSFTYDVTKQFQAKKGRENVLAAQVTPGWWADKIITPSGSNGMYGQKCAFRGVLELTFADGTKRLYGTNTADWKAGIAGPVVHAAIFDGEAYDAHFPLGFNSPDKLSTPAVSTEYRGIIVPENGAEVYLLDELALNPKQAYVYSKTEDANEDAYGKIVIDRMYKEGEPMTVSPGEHLVIDFGQNCAAVPSFQFRAKEGTCLTCLPAELLNDGNGARSRGMDGPEGSIHRRNLRIHQKSIRLDYTFASEGESSRFIPRSTFFGYRYVDITVTGEVVIERIQSIPVSSITPAMQTGHITTGNDDINQLISNTVWGMRSNYLSVPTDCPQRNERLGWTADTQVFCETASFFADTRRFFHKWLHDLRDSQNDEGGYPSVAPPGQYGSGRDEYMRFGWSDAGIIVPWTIWKQFGDTTIIEEYWESMKRYMDHISATKYDHQTLSRENGNYQWGDWLSYEPLETCGRGAFDKNGPLPEAIEYWNYLGASYWAMDAAMMADMAKATGRTSAQRECERTMQTAKDYLREHFFNPDGTFKIPILNTMQTPALFALRNGLFTGTEKERMIERLRENFRQHGDCLQTGFLGTSILMPTLSENGMTDVAYTLLFQRKNPSWLYSIDNGATTIWERWNSYTKEYGMGPKGMNSFNHYAYGAVCQWMWQTCAGIASDPAKPGFRHIIMKPVPDRRLGRLDAVYPSAAGTIGSHWYYDGDDWIWTFTIPEGSTASITLPGENETREYPSGTYTLRISSGV
ncbi:MAG: family 78 glycoside hydrolase catalytic domain [Bacteroidaceae bacterium]|nr:family 78 glycoside hydrolase catalytic domain [Bacteroidaceae bacterium]